MWNHYDNPLTMEDSERFEEVIKGTNFNSWEEGSMNVDTVDTGMETVDGLTSF